MSIITKTILLNLVIMPLFLLFYCSPEKHVYDSFGIYLSQDGTLLLSDKDIEAYVRVEHKLLLNQDGMTKWNSWVSYDSNQSPPIPVLSGGLYQKDFFIKLDGDIIYAGAFWSMASSLSCDGIVILDALLPCDSTRNWISIENGYAAQPTPDLREDDRIFDFFDSKGKLH